MLEIDGAAGEGGGQVLRSSLALAMHTGQAFRITQIRGRRKKPGLLRQHLTGVRAAAAISGATVSGDELRSGELTFEPGPVRAGQYHFAVGTAGSANLVLQTVLPALMLTSDESELVLEGGTHNPASPPFHFLRAAFLPLLARMGPEVTMELERWGFYPAGGGRMRVKVRPVRGLAPLVLEQRGPVRRIEVVAAVANLRRAIAHREAKVAGAGLELAPAHVHVEEVDSVGPGNVVWARCEAEHVTALFSSFGQRGVPADRVSEPLVSEVKAWLDRDVPVQEHLADQLLLPIALAGEGRFVTGPPSPHTRTNIEVIEQFLGRRFTEEALEGGRVRLRLP